MLTLKYLIDAEPILSVQPSTLYLFFFPWFQAKLPEKEQLFIHKYGANYLSTPKYRI
jgi:hypothetical protein